MLLDTGILSDIYPLRRGDAPSGVGRHSLSCRRADARYLARLYEAERQRRADATGPAAADHGTAAPADEALTVARCFARFAAALSREHGLEAAPWHVESAYAMLRRRVDAAARRRDRMIIAGLAAAALAGQGMRVHVVTADEQGTRHLASWLTPVLERLGIETGAVYPRMDEAARTRAYRAPVAVLSAREVAMDFLRDAVHWPERGNAALRTVDQLMGARARSRAIVMRGLPSAIHVDLDATLIDNARTPIVLTRDAHPMHETEELKRALELAGRLEPELHYELAGEDREVALSGEGRRQLEAWGSQLGGLWTVPHVAELLISAAILARAVLRKDVHYRVENDTVEWLVQERLVPGMAYYSRAFVTRMVETAEQCSVSSQREEVGRTSYQRVFNRYVHLCGVCHAMDGIERELQGIYGLKRARRVRPTQATRFHAAFVLKQSSDKPGWAAEWVGRGDNGACSVIVADHDDTLEALRQALEPACAGLSMLTEATSQGPETLLQAGTVVLARAATLELVMSDLPEPVPHPVRILVTERSTSRNADLRNLFWMQAQSFTGAERTLLLAADDALFEDAAPGAPRAGAGGRRVSPGRLERRIRRIQRNRGRAMYRLRRNLLTHESNMQGLLSFSGRGVYE